jgi:phenylacetate-CoA ligase
MGLIPFLGASLGALWRERRLDAAQMLVVREARLKDLLLHAQRTTTLGKERLGEGELPPLDSIRPIDKLELMRRFDDSIADRAVTRAEVEAFVAGGGAFAELMKGRYYVATTSGTTGQIGHFITDATSFARLNGALFARTLRHRLIPREVIRFCFGRRYRMAMAIATEGHFISRLVGSFQPLISRWFMKMRLFSVMTARQETIAELNRYRPHYLHSYPTYLEALAQAQLGGELKIDPEFISLGSEPVSPVARELFRRAFPNSEVSETYAATECLVMANQCRLGRLHINEDLCVLEPVDAGGKPVPPGVPSAKVYVTNLENRAQPIIRYELPDSITLLPEGCACGAGMRAIRVEGRADDTFFLRDASGRYQAHPPLPFEALFLNLPGLAQYQLVHEAQNELRIRYVTAPGADTSEVGRTLSERFGGYLEKNELAATVRHGVEPVAAIEREARGHKLRQVISKVPRP